MRYSFSCCGCHRWVDPDGLGKGIRLWDPSNEAFGMTGPGGLKGPAALLQHALGSIVMHVVRGEHRDPAMAMFGVVPREVSVIKGGLNGSTQHFILNEEMECMRMTRRNGRGFSSAEKTELWDRWQRGESLKAIVRVFGKPSSSIYFQLSPNGGIRPSPRRRSRLALSLWEREEISRGRCHVNRHLASLWAPTPEIMRRSSLAATVSSHRRGIRGVFGGRPDGVGR